MTSFAQQFLALGIFSQALLSGFAELFLTTFGPGGAYLSQALDSFLGSYSGIADSITLLDPAIAQFFSGFALAGDALNSVMQFLLFDGIEVLGYNVALFPLAESFLGIFGIELAGFSALPLLLSVALAISFVLAVMSAVLGIINLVTNFVALFA